MPDDSSQTPGVMPGGVPGEAPGSLRAVLFDMDGTLVDTEELWRQAVEHVAAALGYEFTEADVSHVLGRPVGHAAAWLRRASGTGASLATVTADLDREFAARVAARIVPRPGAVELLDDLRRDGVAIGLVSASPRPVVDMVLRFLGPGRFAVVVTADDTENTKPAPDPYLMAARALGVPPGACVAVEDSPAGVRSAEAAGCGVLAVPSLAPIPPAPGRTVIGGLERADVALLRAIAARTARNAGRDAGPHTGLHTGPHTGRRAERGQGRAPRFLVPAFTTRRGRVGEVFGATVSGLLRGGDAGPVTYAKSGGAHWVRVRPDGTLGGTPTEAGLFEVTVTAAGERGDAAGVVVRIPVTARSEPFTGELRVMSWNLWLGGTRVDGHRDKQLRVLLDADVDVAGLQETRSTSAKELAEALGWHHHQAGHNLGVISRYPIIARFGDPAPSGYGAAGAAIRLGPGPEDAHDLVVWSAHLNYTPYGPYEACFDGLPMDALIDHESASGRLTQMREILAGMSGDLSRADSVPVLLVGDFNVPSHLDWTAAAAPSHCGYGPVAWPVTLAAEDAGLRDSFRVAHPDPVAEPGVTWSPIHIEHEGGGGRAEPQDRIDYVLYAGAGLDVLDSTTYASGSHRPHPDVKDNEWPSDHAAVITTFAVRPSAACRITGSAQ